MRAARSVDPLLRATCGGSCSLLSSEPLVQTRILQATSQPSGAAVKAPNYRPRPMCPNHPDTVKENCVKDGCHGSARCPHEKYWSAACDQCGRVPPKRTTGAHASCAHGKQMRASCKQCGRKSARTDVNASCAHGKEMRASCKQCGRKSKNNLARSAAVRA